MFKYKITQNESFKKERPGVKASYYQLLQTEGGTTLAVANITGTHGKSTTGDKSRIYYILEGTGIFTINGEEIIGEEKDVVVIPPHTTYNYYPKSAKMKIILVMELASFD